MSVAGRKVVVVTPAGRRRYLEILAKYVLGDPGVDEWHIWVNTEDYLDREWMYDLCEREERVHLIESPKPFDGGPVGFRIHSFYPRAGNPDAVYVRADDDIVWAEEGAFSELADMRLADPEPFLLYGNILNNARTSMFHQWAGRLPTEFGVCGPECMDAVGWGSGKFAAELHHRFLADPDPEKWRVPRQRFSRYERVSVNVISWTGEDAVAWCDRVNPDEEPCMSCWLPKEFSRPCESSGSPLFVHYAFHSQRSVVDGNTDILAGYRRLAGL